LRFGCRPQPPGSLVEMGLKEFESFLDRAGIGHAGSVGVLK